MLLYSTVLLFITIVLRWTPSNRLLTANLAYMSTYSLLYYFEGAVTIVAIAGGSSVFGNNIDFDR